jgi:hypothetical protein
MLKTTAYFARLPFASVQIKISALMLVLMYLIVTLLFVWLKYLSGKFKVEEVKAL